MQAMDYIFYVTSRGYAGDHWYSWFAKALNAHADIFAYLANEGSRPKYFNERLRSERPDIIPFSHFMADVGMTYAAIGDCYSYRINQLLPLLEKVDATIPVVNLVRHPYVWLEFYVTWRVNNMRMPQGSAQTLDQEWHSLHHELFAKLGLQYAREDVERWATFQGMCHLNYIVPDTNSHIRQVPLETLVRSPGLFQQVVSYLTRDRISSYADDLLQQIYSWVYTPFRGEEYRRMVPKEIYAGWPQWKRDALQLLHSEEARSRYQSLGYIYAE